jgi:hypothetical protein
MHNKNKAPTPKRQAQSAPDETDPMAKQITDARQAPFVWFDTKLDDAGLSPYAFRLYCRIARRTGGGKTNFFEALTNAAHACKMSERQARYAIKDLLKMRMVKCLQKMPGYPTIYALTDKADWIHLPADADPPLHQMQATPAPDADPPLHQMPDSPAPNADPPLHQMPTKKNHASSSRKKTAAAEAAAATRARNDTNPLDAAAASIHSRDQIEEFVRLTKPHAKNPGGLARTLHRSGEEDKQITAWIRSTMQAKKQKQRPQKTVPQAAVDELRRQADALGLHIPGLN